MLEISVRTVEHHRENIMKSLTCTAGPSWYATR